MGCIMSQSEYQRHAQECLRWAAEAKNEKHRQMYLDLAKAWTRAAMRAGQNQNKEESDQGAQYSEWLVHFQRFLKRPGANCV